MTGPRDRSIGRVLVVGTGLIGTSVGLALRRAGVQVALSDSDPRAAALAAALGAGDLEAGGAPDVVVLAVPPTQVMSVAIKHFRSFPQSTFVDVCSVKVKPLIEVEAIPRLATLFVGSHPLAGSERSGPAPARADLFQGRPWVLTPTAGTTPPALDRARALVELTGAVPVVMSAHEHDAAVALVSHVPQLMASLTAARLVSADAGQLALAGPGIRDVTRIAGSDPQLWAEILSSNAGPVRAVLEEVSAELDRVLRALSSLAVPTEPAAEPGSAGLGSVSDVSRSRETSKSTNVTPPPVWGGSPAPVEVLVDLVRRGNLGRSRIPGKHGSAAVEFAVVPVVVPDRPGELARLFVAAGDAGVNVEDVAIDHSPGEPVGLVGLSVQPEAADRLTAALRAGGWSVH